MVRVFGWVKPGCAMKVKNGTPLPRLHGCTIDRPRDLSKGLRMSIIDRTRKMVNYA